MTFARRIPAQVTDLARRIHARQELRRELAMLSTIEADELLALTSPETDPDLRRMLVQARTRREQLPFWAA